MTSFPSTCGICDVCHISKPSEVWCPECDQGLCIDCTQHHSLSNASRNHSTIPISEYQKLPSFVLESREFCNEHSERFQLYCKEHGCICCRICMVENHSECKNVTILEKIDLHSRSPSRGFAYTNNQKEEKRTTPPKYGNRFIPMAHLNRYNSLHLHDSSETVVFLDNIVPTAWGVYIGTDNEFVITTSAFVDYSSN